MLSIYQYIMRRNEERLKSLLQKRVNNGKEHPKRFIEKQGISDVARPDGALIWLHAASLGEAQSALILIQYFLNQYPDLHILVTTGTLSSAHMIEKNLTSRTLHQFFPLDHPDWCNNFLKHWQPNLVFWMESELWPNMLMEVKARNIPTVLVNARMSQRSMLAWRVFKRSARTVLSAFDLVLCQTLRDMKTFQRLGAKHCVMTGNLKYSAQALPYDKKELQILHTTTQNRPIWLYASTHKGEEALACRIHQTLQKEFPDLLTIIIPRHPERRKDIAEESKAFGLNIKFRGEQKTCPTPETEIYIADTLGEMGLFYRLAAIACIGRTFSNDGGGGHNPIEAAQLKCAVLHGPHVHNLQDIFDEMNTQLAALCVADEKALTDIIRQLLKTPERLLELQNIALAYAKSKSNILENVLKALTPIVNTAKL